MVAAAQTPEYDDWKVRQNEVFVDVSGRRLEVYRVLKRLYVTPFADPRKEDREWRIQVLLTPADSSDSPTVDFTARQVTVPAHVWQEADRYFAQVRSLLGPPTAPPQAEPMPAVEAIPVPPPLPADTASSEQNSAAANGGASHPTAESPGSGTPEGAAINPVEPLPERR